ncbi:MAG: hypothetical protein JST39_00400, partial [Bacteroidetes bacterium]|nr:hypothetical protein [Bacteroidota bacterium]
KSEYNATASGLYQLSVYRYPHPENTDNGKFSLIVHSLNSTELSERKAIQKELAAENAKTVLTADIDHFWQAFDKLSSCKTFADSTTVFQKTYLDRASDGLVDFIAARDLTAEKYVRLVARHPKFFASVRKNTYSVKGTEPVIQQLFDKFRSLYGNFRPFKVCFAIGILNTGGTVSDRFVLIGTEITASSQGVDVSEFVRDKDMNKAKLLTGADDLVQKVRNIVAHECVHTQQKPGDDSTAKCPLLNQVLREGICDFIGELVAGGQINTATHIYGDAHEKALWEELKANLCSGSMSQWLYNGSRSGDRPPDLGYYMGYRIAQAYYNQAADKKQAITDIIEMRRPMEFLQQSAYAP